MKTIGVRGVKNLIKHVKANPEDWRLLLFATLSLGMGSKVPIKRQNELMKEMKSVRQQAEQICKMMEVK